jgi:DNA-binding SARP family transcriptional activator
VKAQISSDGGQAPGELEPLHNPDAPEQWPVLICLLGEFRVLKLGQPVPLRRAGKSEGLLGALALRRERGVARETLEATLWPDADEALARQSLNSLVYSVQKLLADVLDGATPIVSRDGNYRLNRDAGIAVDVALFETLARDGEWQARCGERERATERQNAAVALYRGDLQVGDDVYAAVERERLRARYLTLLAHLADHHFAHGEYGLCLEHALRLVGQEPCREDAHRAAMRCYVRLGERAQALRQYRLCERVLKAEFDMGPEAATTALFDEIRVDPRSV